MKIAIEGLTIGCFEAKTRLFGKKEEEIRSNTTPNTRPSSRPSSRPDSTSNSRVDKGNDHSEVERKDKMALGKSKCVRGFFTRVMVGNYAKAIVGSFTKAMGRLSILCIVLSLSRVEARWMAFDELPATYELLESIIKVNADASADLTDKMRIIIKNDRGREYGTLRWQYKPEESSLEVKEASIENKGQVKKVERSQIVDSFVETSTVGFDRRRELVVSFPDVKVGSVLNITVNQKMKRPLYSGHFGLWVNPSIEKSVDKFSLHIEGKQKLFVDLQDPEKKLSVTYREKSGQFIWDIKNTEPLNNKIIDENDVAFPYEKVPRILVSTSPSVEALHAGYVEPYEKIIGVSTPSAYSEILRSAKAKTNSKEQISSVVSQLANKLRYMGDWRSVGGAMVPTPLDEVASRGYGDCKDMASTLTNILRSLGYEAYVALVWRGSDPVPIPKYGASIYNHAITAVKLKPEDKDFLWIDPTNFETFIEGPMSDIAERNALILKKGGPLLTFIPPVGIEKNKTRFLSQLRLEKEIWTQKVTYQVEGLPAVKLTGLSLRKSPQEIQSYFTKFLFSSKPGVSVVFNPFKLDERIVNPIEIRGDGKLPLEPQYTNMGPAVPFYGPETLYNLSKIDVEKRVGHFYLGDREDEYTEWEYENVRGVGEKSLDCEVQSPWFDYKLTLKLKPTVKIIYQQKIKKTKITVDEMKTAEFKKFYKKVNFCRAPRAFIYEKVRRS